MPRGIRRRRGAERHEETANGPRSLAELVDALPDELRSRALTHSSWTDHQPDSYGRLAFLGDSVLGLAVAEHLFRSDPQAGIGRLTKVHGQAVSGRACADVAIALEVEARLLDARPAAAEGGIDVDSLLASERALASICEAMIGACYLQHGFEVTAVATVAAFADQIERAREELLDFKSALQERLARRGERVTYVVRNEKGPPHDRRFEVVARVEAEVIGEGAGRSKKAAEQAAA